MRKSIFALLILLLATPAFAGGGATMMMVGVGTVSTGVDECAGMLVCQNWETPTTGWDHSETWTPARQTGDAMDNTCSSAPCPLRGTQSIKLTGGNTGTLVVKSPTWDNTSTNEIWAHLMVSIDNVATATNRVASLYTPDGSTALLYMNVVTSGAPQLFVGSGQVNGSAGAFVSGTVYHVWLHYTTGTGSNAVGDMYYGTTNVRAAATKKSLTNGTSILNAGMLDIRASQVNTVVHRDQVYVSTTEIVDVPE